VEIVLILLFVALSAAIILPFASGMVRYIPNHKVGVKERLFSGRGSLTSGVIALDGEAGFQPDVLRGGWHILPPFQYRVHLVPLVTIPQGRLGYVYARDGRPLPSTQTLASNPDAADGTPVDFQDTRAFLSQGGQRGPQRRLLREGTYAFNLAQFAVFTDQRVYYLPLDPAEADSFARMAAAIAERDGYSPVVIRGADDMIGVITVHDGPSLPQGDIIAPVVGTDSASRSTWHNNFQDADRFLAAGGFRGRQFQVLSEGTWTINRLFATVELVKKTIVDVGTVGVVVSYTGSAGDDRSGDDYKHGELVDSGRRGVWKEPLLPGKYAFNPYAGKVIPVPTTNFILKWQQSAVGSHRYDENLAEVSLITKDAFEPTLPLSVVVHIDYRKAPLVIQRFGDVKRLVEQTLDPMVAAYFKNVGQTRTLIQLIHDRSAIQAQSGMEMREKFEHYNLELEEVLIGTPGSATGSGAIEQILSQIRARQLADEQVETFSRQEKAATQERQLREAEARAKQQARITESELSIDVESNQGKAAYQRAVQDAARTRAATEAEANRSRLLADAEANRIRVTAEAEAERAARVGIAQAMAAEEQVRAYGGPRYQVLQAVMSRFAEAVEKSGVELVPRVVVSNGGEGAKGTNAFESLLTLLLTEHISGQDSVSAPRSPEVEALREQLRSSRPGTRAEPAAPRE